MIAPLTLLFAGLVIGFLWGSYHRERRNQAEWRDYQAFLTAQRQGWAARLRHRKALLEDADLGGDPSILPAVLRMS
jgi:hypothetical protein